MMSMKYNVNLIIVDPKDKDTKELNYEVGFYHEPNDYGNGYRVWLNNKDTGYEEGFDLRYSTEFDENHPELWITDYVYHNWTGENGSYDIQKITIERI